MCTGLDEGPMGMSGLISRSSGPDANRDLSEPLWVANPGGRRAARGRRGLRVHLLPVRAADGRLGHPNPLNLEAGVSMRGHSPDGVIAEDQRRSGACSSARAGSLHPAITSQPGVSPTERCPVRATPWTRPGPGVLVVLDHCWAQPNCTTRHICGANSRRAREARNAAPATREVIGMLPAEREAHWPPRSSRRWVTNSCASEACP